MDRPFAGLDGASGLAGQPLLRMSIRKAVETDVPVIEACARQAYEIYVERLGREPAPMVADFALQVRSGYVFVVGGGEEIFGFVVFYPREDHIHLENVAVWPQHQGHGYGGQLISFVEERARQAGLAAVELYTNEQMFENIRIYRKLGYVETGRMSQDGFNRVFFRKAV